MNNFVLKEQINYYDLTRPKYTEEIIQEIMKNVRGNEMYYDIACGCGQVYIYINK